MKNFAVAGMIALGIGIVILVSYVSANNTEVSLRNAFTAQQKSNESSFDKMWKTIKQNADISDTERDSFKKTYVEIMNATKGVAGQGALASFFTQARVNITPDLFLKLMTTVESQRESFHRDQQHLLKIKQQHDDVLAKLPSSIWVGGRPHLEAVIVTSAKTSEAFSTGTDDDTDLFSRNAATKPAEKN